MTEYLESPESDKTPQPIAEDRGQDGSVAGGLTELSIRVWSIDPEHVTWSSGHAVICLMADLVTASGGQLVPESWQTLIARFDHQEAAVGAARRLQRALRAFTESPETAALAAGIAIHSPADQTRSGTALDVSNLLSHSVPGQILVSGSVYETLQFTPGLRFQPVPADSLSSGPECQELLWTDPETLAAWQNRVDAASHFLEAEVPHAPSQIGVADAEPLKADSLADPAVGYGEDEFQISVGGSPRKSKVWFAVGAVFFVLVAAIGVFVHLNTRKTLQTPPPPAKTQTLNPPAIAQPDNSTVPGNSLEQQPGTATEKTQSKPAHSRVPPSVRKPARVTEAPATEYEGFTSKQIPQLLHKAEEDAGAGNYGNAKMEYEIILKLQPGNSAAREGLRKLAMKIEESR